MDHEIEAGRRRLFEPVRVAGLDLRNRVVMSPMSRHTSRGGILPDSPYYRLRAEGGVGLIVTEGVAIDHPVADYMDDCPRIASREERAAWRRAVAEVHAAGGKIMLQLWHTGIQRRMEACFHPDLPSASPSGHYPGRDVRFPASTEDELLAIIEAYGRTARIARDVGFDGVEIHGAHGYLLDQFLWQETNGRTDRWGGSLPNRLRFAQEVVREIKRAAGADFPLFLRFSQWKNDAYDARIADDPEMLGALLRPLAEAGVDLFDASTRRFWDAAFPGSDLNLAGWARQVTGKPAMTVGSIGLSGPLEAAKRIRGEVEPVAAPASLDGLYRRLARAEFDLVAVGRALLVNPDWVRLVETGRLDRLASYSKDAGTLALA